MLDTYAFSLSHANIDLERMKLMLKSVGYTGVSGAFGCANIKN